VTDNKDWQTDFYEKAAKKSLQIIPIFKYLYFAVLVISLGFGSYFELSQVPNFQTFYNLGRWFGRSALTLLGVVVLPGILGRFGIEIKLTRIITLFRRQLGILIFVLAFSHYHLVRGMPKFVGLYPLLPQALFEYFGVLALTFLFFYVFDIKQLFPEKTWQKLEKIA